MTTPQKPLYLKFAVLCLLIAVAAFSRMVPHMPNFSPLGAIGVFGAAYFSKKWQAILVPIAAVFLSDLFINNVIYSQYNPTFVWTYGGWYWQYGAYLLIIFAGFGIFSKTVKPLNIVAAGLSSTIIFFLVSNFGVWASGGYPQTGAGLLACYAAGIPFIKGTLLGDLFYCILLFGSYELIKRQVFRPETQPA